MVIKYPSSIPLARTPTVLEPMDRLTHALGGPRFWIKRDDLTGCELTGNKVRKLEFVLAEALSQGADTIITCGGIQSNHCRATAFACARLGLKCHLVLRGEMPARPEGNLFLDHLAGAEVSLFARPEYSTRRDEIMHDLAGRYAANGRKAYLVPTGASDEIGAWGYISAAEELHAEFHRLQINPDAIVHACGSGGTQAGLVLGAALYGLKAQIMSVNVCDDAAYFQDKIRADMRAWRKRYGDHSIDVDILPIEVMDGHVGPGYAQATPEIFDTIRMVARLEGVILDPVYTGKAFTGMLKEVKSGKLKDARNIVFIHTGGIYGLLAQSGEVRF